MADASPAPAPAPLSIDEFRRLDLRVGVVKSAAPHPNADRLLVVEVDLGGETRQVVAGIRAWYPPETLVGRRVIVVANLQPATLRGVESRGMILAATEEAPDGRKVRVLSVDGEAPAGSRVS